MDRGDPFGQDAGYVEMASAWLTDARTNGATWISDDGVPHLFQSALVLESRSPSSRSTQRQRYMDSRPSIRHYIEAGLVRSPVQCGPLTLTCPNDTATRSRQFRGLARHDHETRDGRDLDHFTRSPTDGDGELASATINWN